MRSGSVTSAAAVVVVTMLLLVMVARPPPPVLAELLPGRCPNFTTVPDFDVAAYLGRWYEARRFYTRFQSGQTCNTADYGPLDATTVSVTNSGLDESGQRVTIVGNATTTDVSGALIVYLPGAPPQGGTYDVLGVDYAAFASVFSCQQETEEVTQQFAWILSREQVLSPELMIEAEAAFVANGVELAPFQDTPQGGACTYTPAP